MDDSAAASTNSSGPRDRLAAVRESAAWVCAEARHVKLNAEAVAALAGEVAAQAKDHPVLEGGAEGGVGWGEEIHFVSGSEAAVVQYLFVVDALNFCFWPSEGGWEYEDLSTALKRALEEDAEVLSADRLAHMSEEALCRLLGGRALPNMPARVEHLRQVGACLQERWSGSAAAMVRACDGSAGRLVDMIVTSFPGFQDHLQYKGREVCFYKRAQILAGDIWGALKGKGLGAMHDVEQLTMFADYRVPQILEARGVLEYSQALKKRIMDKEELPQGGEEEVEIRAATVHAVEELKRVLRDAHSMNIMSIKIDWYLWEEGERQDRAGTLPPHHRTLTTFY